MHYNKQTTALLEFKFVACSNPVYTCLVGLVEQATNYIELGNDED
jgi:hypothetical protein